MRDDVRLAAALLDSAPGIEPVVLLRAVLGADGEAGPFDVGLLDRLRTQLGSDLVRAAAVVESAAAIKENTAAQHGPTSTWTPVITAPTDVRGLSITARTGAMMIRHLESSRRLVRLYAPYATSSGLRLLEEHLERAIQRGVRVQVCLPQDPDGNRTPVSVIPSGLRGLLEMTHVRNGQAWPHLKLFTFDGRAAYVGSANLTERGLAGKNLELGVLVEGPDVAALDELLDEVLAPVV